MGPFLTFLQFNVHRLEDYLEVVSVSDDLEDVFVFSSYFSLSFFFLFLLFLI